MQRTVFTLLTVTAAVAAIVALKQTAGTADMIWTLSDGGSWLLPLVLVSSVLDSVHPCSFSILLVTVAFLFALQMGRGKILQIGATYIGGIFLAYLLIGLGMLKVLHLFDTPHFMGRLGAALLIGFGGLNILNALVPSFPLRLKIPASSHRAMATLMEQASLPAAFGLGVLVGICQFPCMGGPYLMVIGLLRDQVTYWTGFAYLVLYNLVLILPLAAVLWMASDSALLERLQGWKKTNLRAVRQWSGAAMVGLGALVLYI